MTWASLDGKVAVITGAAHGLGRVEALELARQGARIVVNDLGTNADGTGRDESAARAVVEEIEKLGGEAVPHFGDVAVWNDAQALIKTAVDAFGDLNILVCNAGFTRDAVIFNMSEDDFDSVVRVHLKGHFAPMKFATIYWREQSKARGGPVYGRMINTSSESFLFGSPGQPNYAAAKAGIVSLTMGTAKVLLKYGVTANVVMPRARTRMTLRGPVRGHVRGAGRGLRQHEPGQQLAAVRLSREPRRREHHRAAVHRLGQAGRGDGAPGARRRFDNDEAWTVEACTATSARTSRSSSRSSTATRCPRSRQGPIAAS